MNAPVNISAVIATCRCSKSMMCPFVRRLTASGATQKISLIVLSDESQEKTTTLYECLPDSAFKDTSHLAVNPFHPLLHAPHAGFQASDLDSLILDGSSRALGRYLREFFD